MEPEPAINVILRTIPPTLAVSQLGLRGDLSPVPMRTPSEMTARPLQLSWRDQGLTVGLVFGLACHSPTKYDTGEADNSVDSHSINESAEPIFWWYPQQQQTRTQPSTLRSG